MKQEIHDIQMGNSVPTHINSVQRQDILRRGIPDCIKGSKFPVNCALACQKIGNLDKTFLSVPDCDKIHFLFSDAYPLANFDLSIVIQLRILRLIAFGSEITYNPSRFGDRNDHTRHRQAECCFLSCIATCLKMYCFPRIPPSDNQMPGVPI